MQDKKLIRHKPSFFNKSCSKFANPNLLPIRVFAELEKSERELLKSRHSRCIAEDFKK
ncbi:unnamed protein product [Oikopleura dioica]|uniref:Uncharacterized protein n=1 Tax=Oikopleura dioica TaxID=34765 RepID=E4YET1_OIKDI|nr:unnamed protein product [Oikopleura dioica]